MGKGEVCDSSVGAVVKLEVGSVVGVSVGTIVRVTHISSQAGEGWTEVACRRTHQLKQIYVCGGGRRGCGGQVMIQEGALEGCDGKATLKGGQQGCKHQGLPPGPDGTFHVGSQLPGGKARLKQIAGAVKRLGGRVQEKTVGTARKLGNGGGDAVWDDLQDRLCNVCWHEGNIVGTTHDPSYYSTATWWAVLSRYLGWMEESEVTCISNSAWSVPRNDALRAKCRGINSTRVGKKSAGIYPFITQILPGPSSYLPPVT